MFEQSINDKNCTVLQKDLMRVLAYQTAALNSPTAIFELYFRLKLIKLINFFLFQDKIPAFLRSDIVYKFEWGGCKAT